MTRLKLFQIDALIASMSGVNGGDSAFRHAPAYLLPSAHQRPRGGSRCPVSCGDASLNHVIAPDDCLVVLAHP